MDLHIIANETGIPIEPYSILKGFRPIYYSSRPTSIQIFVKNRVFFGLLAKIVLIRHIQPATRAVASPSWLPIAIINAERFASRCFPSTNTNGFFNRGWSWIRKLSTETHKWRKWRHRSTQVRKEEIANGKLPFSPTLFSPLPCYSIGMVRIE